MTTNILASQELSYLSNLSAGEGYQVLNKGLKTAITNFEATPQSKTAIQQFEAGVAQTTSVTQFVDNPKLVDFVLSAFGLDSEDSYQGLIKDVLTQNPNSAGSLVNQLTDPRFKQMATALDFYANGLGQLKAIGEGSPTSATVAEGVTLSPATAASTSSGATSVGLGVSGNEYLVLQNSAGNTVYAQSAYFTLNSHNQLATSDGSTLKDGIALPANTTGVTVTDTGTLYAQVKGTATPVQVGVLEVATFQNASKLSESKSGYYTPTSQSGSAKPTFVSNNSAYAFSNTMQGLVNDYVQNEFEVAVGDNNSAVREALYFGRTIGPDEKAAGTSTRTQADVILGDAVLDNLVYTAIGEPEQVAYEQLSSQEQLIENGVQLKSLQNPKYVSQFVGQYLAMYDASNAVGSSGTSSSQSPALQILSAFSSSGSSSSSASGILSLAV